MNTMKSGAKIKVFIKPMTDEEYEGIAKLVHHQKDDAQIGELWAVLFDGETAPVNRWVNARNLVQNKKL